MTERDDRYVGNDRQSWPHNTGEFRAAQDVSASTAEFKAFAAGQTSGNRPAADTASWPEQPWDPGTTTSGSSGRPVWLIGGVIGVVVLVVVLILLFA